MKEPIPIELSKLNSIHIINKMVESMYTETKMSLTLNQKKMIFYLASLIKENDTELYPVTISFADFFKLVGLEYSTRNLETLMNTVEEINGKSFWIDNGSLLINCSWIKSGTVIDKENKTITICLDDTLKPFFIGISEYARTIFQYGYITSFRCKHSIDLYRYSSRFKNLNAPVKIPMDKALKIFGDGKYHRYNDLMERVIIPSMRELNQYTDLKVNMIPFKSGRKITHLILTVVKKTGKELDDANGWKRTLPSRHILHDFSIDCYKEDLINDAVDIGYLDITDFDDPTISEFDYDIYKIYKKFKEKKEG